MREPQNALARINVGYICLKKRIFGEAIEHLSRAIRLDNDKKATLYAHFYLGLVYLERDMFEDAQTFFQKTLALGPNLIEAYYELGRAYWFNGQRDEATSTRGRRDSRRTSSIRGESVAPRCSRRWKPGGDARRIEDCVSAAAAASIARDVAVLWSLVPARRLRAQDAPERLDRGRFTAVFFPERSRARDVAARWRGRRTTPFPGCRGRRSACCSRSRPTGAAFASGSVRARPSGARRSPFPSRGGS